MSKSINKAFSLVEALVSMLIIAVVITITMPTISILNKVDISKYVKLSGDNITGNLTINGKSLWNNGDMSGNLSTSGYQKFPSGFMVEWGIANINAGQGNYTVSFSEPFTQVYSVQFGKDSSGNTSWANNDTWAEIRDITTTGFTARVVKSDVGSNDYFKDLRWVAMGIH